MIDKRCQDLNLLAESGLIDIQFANFGQSVVLSFCQPDGSPLGHLICHDMLQFEYIDPDFLQAKTSQQIQGFSHYVPKLSVQLQDNSYLFDFQPYISLKVRCKTYEVMLNEQET